MQLERRGAYWASGAGSSERRSPLWRKHDRYARSHALITGSASSIKISFQTESIWTIFINDSQCPSGASTSPDEANHVVISSRRTFTAVICIQHCIELVRNHALHMHWCTHLCCLMRCIENLFTGSYSSIPANNNSSDEGTDTRSISGSFRILSNRKKSINMWQIGVL